MPAPATLEGYTLHEPLHEAPTWVAYRATRDGDAFTVVLLPERRGTPIAEQAKAAYEATRDTAQAALDEHPLVPPIHAWLQSRVGVVYPPIDGISLRTWMQAQLGPVPAASVLPFLLDLLGVLAHAHRANRVHRAISPDTLFVEPGPELRLRAVIGAGFAAALDLEHAWSQTGTLLGDAQYMAPEQLLGAALSPSTDVYAVGLVAYWLLTHTHACEGDSVFELVERQGAEPPPPIDPKRRVPASVRDALARALQKSPTARFEGASMFARALKQESDEHAPTHGLYVPASPSTRRGARPADGPADGSTRDLPGEAQTGALHGDAARVDTWPVQEFYADAQPLEVRRWVGPNATAVDRDAVLAERANADAHADANAHRVERGARPKRRWLRGLIGVWLLLAIIAAVALVVRGPAAPASDEPARAVVPPVVGLPAPDACTWYADRVPDDGRTEVELEGDRRLWLQESEGSYRLHLAQTGARPRALRSFQGEAVQQILVFRFPVSEREFVFLLRGVGEGRSPSMIALQLDDTRLRSIQELPLSTASIEAARVELRASQEGCLVALHVQGDEGAGPEEKQLTLQMVHEGLVAREGGLGALWAP